MLAIGLLSAGCGTIPKSRQFAFLSFESVFRKARDVALPGVAARDAVAFTTDSAGAIYVIDYSSRSVRKFDRDGRPLYALGRRGWRPGEFQMPWGIVCDRRDDVYVIDIQTGRINVFDEAGNFSHSLVLPPLVRPAVALTIDASGSLWVGRLEPQIGPRSPLVYKLGPDGKPQLSLLAEDPLVHSLNLTIVGGVKLAGAPSGHLYAAQTVSPKVSVFSRDGHMLGEFGRIPPYYQPPLKFPRRPPTDAGSLDSLLSRWTQLQDIRIVPMERLVLLTFKVHRPVPYAVEIYTEEGQFVVGGVESLLVPACVAPGGRIYLYNPSGAALTLSEFSVSTSREGRR
jgi:hypothetical protein